MHTRQLSTSNLQQLADFQAKKNRHYTQLEQGKVAANYQEVTIGQLHIFRESINLGSSISASPAETFVPFGFVLPHSGDYNFCGQARIEKSLIVATGGTWDISFSGSIDYISNVFQRDYFYQHYHQLTGEELNQQLAISHLKPIADNIATDYPAVIQRLLSQVNQQVMASPKLMRLLNAEILGLTLNALAATSASEKTLSRQPKRIIGVKRVLGYLEHHASDLPDMSALCQIAQISERSLQYGFIEYLGITPVKYLRALRLNKVHYELLAAQDKSLTVSNVALKWGFLELGRFAQEYKQLFGVLPSQTLKASLR
ncbi:helix-turn-helix domain-containing protein [Thalassotalea euphylliae]|uniref:Helix-turn-helix domain-containing protein n=1 Tax=Thalassotalea euphylliae TaxID=1655234 RepID=A0A3E0TUT3_9GAMM|nr:helix-turn-helix domain-containing protein [Thalassotalea euphylliae]REL28436.1 helix-turn-helix domain-containing protein [Thalassotalea euphylliae]